MGDLAVAQRARIGAENDLELLGRHGHRRLPHPHRFPSPLYHSKYNPIGRRWGILEQHWYGALLDALDTVLQFAATMTWKGAPPRVALVTTAYERGVTLTKEAMAAVEAHLTRHPTLGNWFVEIHPPPAWES